MRKALTVGQSLNAGLHRALERSRDVMVLGEDILDPYGGAFKITAGLSARFPDQVFTTPISESAIVGLASGLALRGFRPVAEIMFGDFVTLAADQLINHAAKFRWMFNEKCRVPMVVRTPSGGYRGYGPTHSQSLEKHFLGVPGLWVVASHVLGDPGALLESAIFENDDPVLFIENKTCYGRPCAAPDGAELREFRTVDAPFPTTWLSDTNEPAGLIFAYGGMVPLAVQAAQELVANEGIAFDVVAVTQLSPTPADHLRQILSKARPSVCVYIEESTVTGGWTAELLASVEGIRRDARLPEILHHRIGAAHSPIPSSRVLEAAALPSPRGIAAEIVGLL